MIRVKSAERVETDKREPHKITSPFVLESPHTHQDPKAAETSPATFLTCAIRKKEGVLGDLMGIKSEKKGKKGDPRVWIICPCKNSTESDSQRKAYAQEIVKGELPTVPPGNHLVDARAVFLKPETQPADKDLFLLQVTHPAINQDTQEKLEESVAQALRAIKDEMEVQKQFETTEANNAYYNKFMASAPPLEEEHQIHEQGATGDTAGTKETPTLPTNSEGKIPGAKDDQNIWASPNMPPLPQLQKRADVSESMIIIYKNDNSKNKKTFKQLAKEHLDDLGFGTLTYPVLSQENAGGIRSEDIWGYLLRYDQIKEEGTQKEKKRGTYAAWIKEDVKEQWLAKAYDTVSLNNDLKMMILVRDINKAPIFNDLKVHFAVWEENVMTFLHALMQKKKQKPGKKGKQNPPPNPTPITATTAELKQEREWIEAIRAQETRNLENIENNKKARETKAKLDKEIEEQNKIKEITAKEIEDQKAKKEDMFKEMITITDAINNLKMAQSARASARTSANTSRRQSRTASPTNLKSKLQIEVQKRKLEKEQEKLKNQIEELDNIKGTEEDMEIEGSEPEESGPSSSSHSDDSDPDSTASEKEDIESEIPRQNKNKKTEYQKKEEYEAKMRLKKAMNPNRFVCPEVECETSSTQEKKLANHIINHHDNTKYAQEAREALQRIKTENKKEKKDRAKNKAKRNKEEAEARHQKEIDDLNKAAAKMEEEYKQNKKHIKTKLEEEHKQKKEVKQEKSDTESQREHSEEEERSNKKQKRKKKKKDRDESEEDDTRNSTKKPKKKKRKKDDKGSDSSSSSSDSEEYKEENNKKKKWKLDVKPLNFKWENYIKPTCLTENPPELLKYFVEKKALTRSDIANPNRAYGDGRFKPMRTLLVAPLFETKYENIFKRLGLVNAANNELMAWYRAWQDARKDGEWENDDVGLQVSNGYDQLIEIKHSPLQSLMNGAPPLKSKRVLSKLTRQDVKQWMHAGRAYCISRGIYWKSFSRYMLTKNTLHEEILEGVRSRMQDKVFNDTAPWLITVYIEQIILEMMAPPEKFADMRIRLIEEHVRTIQKEETTVYMRTKLEEDAVQLTYVDPTYIGTKADGAGYIPDERRRNIKDNNFKKMIIDIITALGYYNDMNEKYLERQPSTEIEEEKPENILNDLTRFIKIKKARRTQEEGGSRVYKTKPEKQNLLGTALNKKIRELEEQLQAAKNKPGMFKESPRGTKAGASYHKLEEVAKSPHKWPCRECETRPGTDREKKDYCTNKHHCRVHDGEYMCMKSQECRERTGKVRALLEYKRTKLPAKANMVTCNEIMHIDDEELDAMDEEEMNQPCFFGRKCPQEPYGHHTTVCKVEMKGLSHRKPGQTWMECALEQEEFNSNPDNYGEGRHQQYGNQYNFKYHSGEEEEGQEEDENK